MIVTDEMVEAGARAIDAHWSEGDGRKFPYEDTEREYQAHCKATARATLTAALSGSDQVVVARTFRSIAQEMEIVAGQHDPEKQTPEQEAACLRALDGMDAQADRWAESINLIAMVKNVSSVSRLNNAVPKYIRAKMADQQEAQVDALIRMAFTEGFYWGGESRKDYDEYRRAMIAASPSLSEGGK